MTPLIDAVPPRCRIRTLCMRLRSIFAFRSRSSSTAGVTAAAAPVFLDATSRTAVSRATSEFQMSCSLGPLGGCRRLGPNFPALGPFLAASPASSPEPLIRRGFAMPSLASSFPVLGRFAAGNPCFDAEAYNRRLKRKASLAVEVSITIYATGTFVQDKVHAPKVHHRC